jgi:hypothetical protein
MAKIRLDLSQFKASGIYTIEFDASESIVLNTQTTRLVVGFSKKGPINAPVFCPDVKTARRIFGDIDKDLENKGSFFHRSLFTCLETGPCFALSLLKLNDDVSSPNADYDTYKSFSLSTTEANGVTASVLYSSFFNKERFYFPDTAYFLANVNNNTVNVGKLLNFVNLGQSPFSIIVSKTGDLTGFNVTARDWFGSGNVPSFVRDFDYISDYFINIDIVQGNWTDFATLSVDPIFSQYFDSTGLIKSRLNLFLNSPYITRIGTFQGSIIPDLVDNNGVNYSIDTIVNAGIATTGLFCALNRNALADYDAANINSPGRVDMIGHTLISQNTGVVNFLSYNFTSSETKDLPQNSTHTVLNNTFQFDLGPSAVSDLPGGLGSTGSTYSASVNGYLQNLPSKVAYFESYYGSGNEGKFNNVLCLRKEAFDTIQYAALSTMIPGSSIALEGATGATQWATISSVNEVQVGSDFVLKLGIAHPDKAFEGTTVGKNAQVLSVTTGASANMVVGGTAAATNINTGDWLFAENTGVRYYFRVGAVAATGSNSQIFVDVTNSVFGGATNIANITTFYRVYWESIAGVAGSLFDVVDPYSTANTAPFISVYQPDKFTYTSVVGQSFYTGYEFSDAYTLFDQGILSDGDEVYVSGVYPQPVYLTASFGQDIDSVKTVTVKAFRDEELTIGYTGPWGFNTILDNTGATYTTTDLLVYSTIGDYETTIGATGFNASYTTCYVSAADEGKVQVGQFLVSDPLNTGNVADYILTRVISKKKISSGTFNTYYQINVNQRMANISSYTAIQRYKSVQEVAQNYQPTYLSGFKLTANHTPNGSNARLAEILSMLDPAVSNLSEALSSRHIIAFRYIIDTFNGGLNTQSYPKNLVTKLAMRRQKCMAIMNAPSIQQFIDSTDPRFTELPTATDPKPVLNTRYISEGGNLSLGPSFTYSLPDEENGAKFAGFFAPFLVIRENNKNFTIPPAADVSNNFIRKFINGQPYSIVAGPRRGVLSNPKLVGLEYDFTDTDRGYLEPFGWNPIVFRRGIGFMIFGNQSAYQRTPSAFNNLHVRDLLITIEEAVEDILANFLFEFNDASTRLQIKSITDAYLDNVRSGGGIYDFKTIMDESNNTPDIIDQNFAIIDIGIEPARGAQKFINRVTVLKTGGINSGGFTVA